MANFITNSDEKSLKKRLITLITKSEELKFLVGFFYFSGIRELYESLKENTDAKIKILVGLNADMTIYGISEFGESEHISGEEKIFNFFESIKKSLNTENFDTAEFYTQVKFFLKMIEEDRLVIRKTYEPNHAKLYIFNLEESQVGRRKLFVTGSSNLTKSGLSTQNEFNVEISDFGCEEAERYFDDLWQNAVLITEKDELKKQLLSTVEHETLVKDITPFEAFCLVLKTYLDSFGSAEVSASLSELLKKNGYKPYRYQIDAVSQALAVLEKYHGVVIADVVGLGKSVIASAIAKQLKKRGLIICPPGLMGDTNKNFGWAKYREEFEIRDWEIRSLGDLENTFEFVKKAKDIEVVIIDEAHRFRNEDTKDYELLKNICREKKVILLTATPFNNRPSDILALLKLFMATKKSPITLENNLAEQFQAFGGAFDRLAFIKKNHDSPDPIKQSKAKAHYKTFFEGDEGIDLKKVANRSRYLAKQIRKVMEPVTIRRNRLDLKNHLEYKEEVKELSVVANPKEWLFYLTKEQSYFYDEVLASYFADPEEGGRFKGAIYRPFEYEKEAGKKRNEKDNRQFLQQKNLFNFMRRLLVKRFESSFGSFEQSIKNFQRITENAQKFIEKTGEYILDRGLLEKIYEMTEDEIEAQLAQYEDKINKGEYPKNHKRYVVVKFDRHSEFLADMKSDLLLFGEILEKLNAFDLVKNDPKTACLAENIKQLMSEKLKEGEPKRKIIIFSEYADTISYLEKTLKEKFGNRLLTISGGLSQQKISALSKNFDASYDGQEDEFDVLLASDRISEGFNLNRAGVVINYDIPWNPVRVIQRLGRINRIGKKVFEELFIVNFFPSEKGATLVQSRVIAGNKMFMIHNTLGEDSKIFDAGEDPTPAGLFEKLMKNPDEQEAESFRTKAYKTFLEIKKEHPDIEERLQSFPSMIKVGKKGEEDELFVFFKKCGLYAVGVKYGEDGKKEPYHTSFEEVYEKIICKNEEPALLWNDDEFWQAYEGAKDFREFRATAQNELSMEQQALNVLETLIKTEREDLTTHKAFLRTLKEDLLNFGTLSEFTWRRIANMEGEKALPEIEKLKSELGENYLAKEKTRQKDTKKEIIIAIENQKS